MTNSTQKNRLHEYLRAPWGDFDSLLSQVLGSNAVRSARGWFAPGSVWEDETSYHVELDVPGIAREDIGLTFDKGQLEIVAERKRPEEDRKGWHDERGYGKVTRTLALPESINPESIKAELTDGVLHVTVEKTPAAQPKRIEVS